MVRILPLENIGERGLKIQIRDADNPLLAEQPDIFSAIFSAIRSIILSYNCTYEMEGPVGTMLFLCKCPSSAVRDALRKDIENIKRCCKH